MQKIIFIALCFLYIVVVQAQSHTESYTICENSYKITCERQADGGIKVTVKDGTNDTLVAEYTVWIYDMEVFAKIFVQHFSAISALPDSCKTAEKNNLLAYGRSLLKNFETSLVNTALPAGVFRLSAQVPLHGYYLNAKGGKENVTATVTYKVTRLQAEISDGYLENIVAYLSSNKDVVKKFTLPFPVGMTSVSNFKKYLTKELYEFKSSPFVISNNKNKPDFFLNLGELIDYDYLLGAKRRDYSPKDTVLDMEGGTSFTLAKEETKKMFEAHIFSDFQGLNETSPNGLLQAEVEKRININTVQHLSKKWMYWLFGSYGYFQYIAPSATVSKLEQHNRRYLLPDLDSVRANPGPTDTVTFGHSFHRYANALDLFQYQWFSAGTDVNIFYINNHDLKYNIYFNAGVKLGFTDVTDSLTSATAGVVTKNGLVHPFTMTSFQAYPEVRINFLPEERFNFSISQRWMYFKLLSSSVQLTGYDKNDVTKLVGKTAAWLNSTELMMTIQTNPKTNAKLFGRVRFNYEGGNIRNNFSQIQLGYSTYILGAK